MERLRDQMEAQAAAGKEALNQRLALASQIHGADEWLVEEAASARGLELGGDMIAATIAADHYLTRTVCPQSFERRLRGKRWQEYANQRLQQVGARFSGAMLLWAVLERIPVNWIPGPTLFAQMGARLEQEGFDSVSIEGSLTPPFPGGADWVRAECAAEIQRLKNGDIDGPCAAVVYWPDRVAAVVLATRAGVTTAFSPRLHRQGVQLQWDGAGAVTGVLLLPAVERPPSGWLMRFWRAVGQNDRVWGWIRGRRIRRKDG
ncbi:MAG: hypothetical protein LAQ69_08505 [Acidobacteriia bacterium]|nr:hypothetical protein [Terriglobia bacterium]